MSPVLSAAAQSLHVARVSNMGSIVNFGHQFLGRADNPAYWLWQDVALQEPYTCSVCNDLTVILYGRNPDYLPDDLKTKLKSGLMIDAKGVCMSCVPVEEFRNNPHWYID